MKAQAGHPSQGDPPHADIAAPWASAPRGLEAQQQPTLGLRQELHGQVARPGERRRRALIHPKQSPILDLGDPP